MRLDDRIAERFKVAIFVGIRKSDRELHTAFFIDRKQAKPRDLTALADSLKHLPEQVRKAYAESSNTPKAKKTKPQRRKPSK